MPELAEVEYYRKQWNPGLGHPVESVALHPKARPFQSACPYEIRRQLRGLTLEASEAHGKKMVFRFSESCWLGLHLGMTGRLHAAPARYRPGQHDHLVLFQGDCALVFSDPRQFGRVQLFVGPGRPDWWSGLPPALTSSRYTLALMVSFLGRHSRLPVKAALLMQTGFPGVGNWMADEILWRAGLDPRLPCGKLSGKSLRILWRQTRWVCRRALATIGRDFSDPPAGWLFHERWDKGRPCPRHGTPLIREPISGRTTAWCPRCQRAPGKG